MNSGIKAQCVDLKSRANDLLTNYYKHLLFVGSGKRVVKNENEWMSAYYGVVGNIFIFKIAGIIFSRLIIYNIMNQTYINNNYMHTCTVSN